NRWLARENVQNDTESRDEEVRVHDIRSEAGEVEAQVGIVDPLCTEQPQEIPQESGKGIKLVEEQGGPSIAESRDEEAKDKMVPEHPDVPVSVALPDASSGEVPEGHDGGI